MSRSVKSILMIIPFAVLYFGARSMPVEPCDFLHEETYKSEDSNYIVEYCQHFVYYIKL